MMPSDLCGQGGCSYSNALRYRGACLLTAPLRLQQSPAAELPLGPAPTLMHGRLIIQSSLTSGRKCWGAPLTSTRTLGHLQRSRWYQALTNPCGIVSYKIEYMFKYSPKCTHYYVMNRLQDLMCLLWVFVPAVVSLNHIV